MSFLLALTFFLVQRTFSWDVTQILLGANTKTFSQALLEKQLHVEILLKVISAIYSCLLVKELYNQYKYTYDYLP